MPFPWIGRKALPPAAAPVLSSRDQELLSMVEANGVNSAIRDEMLKSLDVNNYQAFETLDDQGGYYSPEFDIRSTAARIKGMYSREPWIYVCATKIARTLSSIPFKIYKKGTDEEIMNHPIEVLMKRGGQIQDGKSLFWGGYADLILGGNFFIVTDENYKNLAHVPVELVSIKNAPPQDSRMGLQKIIIYDPLAVQQKKEVDFRYVIHLKLPNPSNPWYGLSPFAAAARPILLDRYKNEYEMAFYLRGATNSGVIETTEDMTRSRMERLMSTFEQAFTGKRNWWRTLFLPKGSKWVTTSLSMKEMDHLEGLRENRNTILAVLGIPPAMVGLTEDVNRATSEQQQRDFYENTIVPTAEFVASGWNNSYLVKTVYQDKIEVRPDFSRIPALQGAMVSKGEQAKAVENYLTLNEIREDILGYPALDPADKRGVMLVPEIIKAAQSPLGGGPDQLNPSAQLPPLGEDDPLLEADDTAPDPALAEPDTVDTNPPDPLNPGNPGSGGEAPKHLMGLERMKSQALSSQERIETKIGNEFKGAFKKYQNELLSQAKHALQTHRDVKNYLAAYQKERKDVYWKAVGPILFRAMDRGFSFAHSQVKMIRNHAIKIQDDPRFTDIDRQAMDVIRERTQDGKRKMLEERGLMRFEGFDKTQTEGIVRIIENGYEQGQAWSDIADTIESDYGENYSGQADTIVRTEVLTAVSQGVKWNQEALESVFTEVQKQWLSYNDDVAREEHEEFEQLGPVDSDYEWIDGLAYPRDYRAEAGEVINCRCTMISIIPPNATSNAAGILESEL